MPQNAKEQLLDHIEKNKGVDARRRLQNDREMLQKIIDDNHLSEESIKHNPDGLDRAAADFTRLEQNLATQQLPAGVTTGQRPVVILNPNEPVIPNPLDTKDKGIAQEEKIAQNQMQQQSTTPTTTTTPTLRPPTSGGGKTS